MKATAEQKGKLNALGLSDQQIADMEAKNIDWQKFLAALPQLISMILSMFG